MERLSPVFKPGMEPSKDPFYRIYRGEEQVELPLQTPKGTLNKGTVPPPEELLRRDPFLPIGRNSFFASKLLP